MPVPSSIKIPEDQLPIITSFLETPTEVLNELALSLNSAPPFSDVEDLAEHCKKNIDLASATIEGTIVLAINLNRIQRNVDISSVEVTALVAKSLCQQLPDWETVFANSWETRVPLLQQVLQPDGTIEVMAKARELLMESQSVFLDSTVLTDIRYIYSSDASQVLGGLVLNTLSFDYLEGHSQVQQAHIVLSEKELEKLLKQLQRALLKAKTATALLTQASLKELTPKRDKP